MQPNPAPLLVIRRQDASPAQIEWDKPILMLGRDSANDIIIDHPLASRRHARLEHDENGYFVRDLESTNGTYLNGDRIEGARPLRNQDKVWVADTEIIFNDPEATQKGPLPVEILKRVRAGEEGLRIEPTLLYRGSVHGQVMRRAAFRHGTTLKPGVPRASRPAEAALFAVGDVIQRKRRLFRVD